MGVRMRELRVMCVDGVSNLYEVVCVGLYGVYARMRACGEVVVWADSNANPTLNCA